MVDFYEPIAPPRALSREEALEMATDLLVKNPMGMGKGNIFLASNISWLTNYVLNLDPASEDLHYVVTAGENFFYQATEDQKDTRTFAECARLLALAYNHMHDDRAKIVLYQESAGRCPEVQAKLDPILGDALQPFEKLAESEDQFPELLTVAEAGLSAAKPGSNRAARWAVVAGLARVHAGDLTIAQEHNKTASADESIKTTPGFLRLQKELKKTEKVEKKAKSRGSFFPLFGRRNEAPIV